MIDDLMKYFPMVIEETKKGEEEKKSVFVMMLYNFHDGNIDKTIKTLDILRGGKTYLTLESLQKYYQEKQEKF